MKAVSQTYKNNIKELGREIQCEISYTQNGVLNTIENDNINSFNFHYESGLLKSTMKQLDLVVNVDIPINTQITARFGVKVNEQYENINIGSFVVYSSEQIKDTNSYKLVCYDKMLNAMKDYEKMQWYSLTEDTRYDSTKRYYELVDGEYWNVIGSILVNPKQEGWYEYTDIKYPITIKDYLSAICNHLEITLASDDFANYDKEIPSELYLDSKGKSLDYTFRDVLDELAQVTASTICINDDDELEIRYINNTQQIINTEYLKDINVNFGEMTPSINTITFKRSADSDAISLSNPIDLADDLKNEIVISGNQILNDDNRDTFLQDILDELYGLSYSINDFNSTGITWLDLCDKYSVVITKTDDEGNVIETNTYPCIMFNDEINVNQGLEEIIHTEKPEESTTDYNTTTKTDRLKTRTDLIVNKQEGFIEAVTGSLQIGEDGQSEVVNGVVSRQTETERTINVITSFDENGNPIGVKTEKGFTFDKNGLNITSSDNTYKTQIDEQGTYYYDGEEILGQTTKDGSKFKNMDLYGEFRYGKDDINDTTHPPLFVSMKFNDGSEECFGHFWNGD